MFARQSERQRDRTGHWRAAPPQGGRPLPARPRAVRRRHVGCRICATSRSCAARARMRASRAIRIPPAIRERVFIADDLDGVAAIRADTALPASSRRCSRCSPPTRCATSASRSPCASRRRCAEAEDIAARSRSISTTCRSLHDMLAARAPGAPLVHETWGDNLFLTTEIDVDFAAAKAKAAVRVTRELRTSRQVMSPLEGPRRAGALGRPARPAGDALVDPAAAHRALRARRMSRPRRGPHPRDRARCRRRLRLQGRPAGRGGRARLGDAQARRAAALDRGPAREPHRRRELPRAPLHRSPPTRTRDGRLLALDCEATVDAGAYSAYPFSACLEAGQVGSILPGLYDFPHYRCRTYSVATNKPPILPYRGVARTGVCFALEVTLDALAREIGIEPAELRRQQPGAPRADAVRQHRQAALRFRRLPRGAAPRRRGDRPRRRCASGSSAASRTAGASASGFAMYSEQAGHGTSVYAAWGIPFVPGYEQCQARFTPDGGLELRIGAHSHGQGLETTLSQVAHAILGVPHDRIKLVHGDTALDALLHRHLGLALHDHVGRRGRGRVRAARRARPADRRQAAAGARARTCGSTTARWSAASGPHRGRPRSPAPGIAGRRTCPATSTRPASR